MKTNSYRTSLTVMLTMLLFFATGRTNAQDATPADYPETGVFVTTQDFLSLRKGPSTYFERIRVVDPAQTYRAVGRSSTTNWIQVVTEDGTAGWLAVRFLVYSGDVTQLPVDGINPEPFIRQAGAVGITTRETTLYVREVSPEQALFTIPEETTVELTGRLGSGTFSRYQILYEDELYWVGAWDIRVLNGNTSRLFDTAYVYPFGRILRQYRSDVRAVEDALNNISNRWETIADGGSVRCEHIPALVVRGVADFDVQQEAVFAPAVAALDAAISGVNSAISAMEDACARAAAGEPFIDYQTMSQILATLNDAAINFELARAVSDPIGARDPLIGILSGGTS